MKRLFLKLVITGLMFPLLLGAQTKSEMYTLNSTKSSGERDVRISYYVLHDTLFSSKLNDNKKIALSDIDFSRRVIKPTGSREDKTDAPVYAIEIRPLAGKSAFKSFGEYAYSYGNDSYDTRTSDAMFVWIGGLERAERVFDDFKSQGNRLTSASGSGTLTVVRTDPFSVDFNNLTFKTEEKKADTPPAAKTSDLFSNDLKLFDKKEETKPETAATAPLDMSPLADIFGAGEVNNSKKSSPTVSSPAAPAPSKSPVSVSTSSATSPVYPDNTMLVGERLAAAKTDILNTVKHVKEIVETMNISVRLASKSSYDIRQQDFREDKERALKALNSAKVRYNGKVNASYIRELDSMITSIKSYQFPAHYSLPK